MELTDSLKALLRETVERLKGHERRRFMAQTVEALGAGGQRLAERELGWNRGLIRKGKREVESGINCLDAFELRGRHLTEHRLPNLLADIKSLVDSQSQSDPKFKTNRLYTRLSAAAVRRQLVSQSGYCLEDLYQFLKYRLQIVLSEWSPSLQSKQLPLESSLPALRASTTATHPNSWATAIATPT